MITRTVKYTNIVYAVISDDLTVEKKAVKVPGKFDIASGLKYVQKKVDKNAVKVVSVDSADVLTAMDEETWLKYAKVVESRYVKVEDR